jgi:peptidoglycan hydrolase CwlO-like protein
MVAAEPVLTTENVGILTALILALSGFVATIIGARSKAKLDDKAKLERALHEAEAELEKAEAQHDAECARYEGRIDVLQEKLDKRDATINVLDERIVALLLWIARLRQRISSHGIDEPDKPAGTEHA